MDCTWVKSLHGIQVGPPLLQPQGFFTLTVTLDGTRVETLINTACMMTLVKSVKGLFTPAILRMKCIHEDIHEYRTKWADIGIGPQIFRHRVGVVLHLS